jgi:hypothetical protein
MESSCYSRLPVLNYSTQWELQNDFRHKFYKDGDLSRAGGTATPYFFLLSTSCAPGTAEYENRRAASLLGHVKLLEQGGLFDYSANKAYLTFDTWYEERGPLLLRRPRESLPPLFAELVFGIHGYYLNYREIESICCEMASITPEDWRTEYHRRQAATATATATAVAAAAAGAAGAGAGAGAAVPEQASQISGSTAESDEEGEEDTVEPFSRETEEVHLAYSRARTELINARRALQSIRTQMSRLLECPRIFHQEGWMALVPCHERLMWVEQAAVQTFEEAYFRLSTMHGMHTKASTLSAPKGRGARWPPAPTMLESSTLLEALENIWLEV